MSDYWQGKVALITGGSAGLGYALAHRLAQQGARVMIAARDVAKLEAARSELSASGPDVAAWTADVTSQSSVNTLVDETVRRFGKLDALLNCAGRSVRGRAIDTAPHQFLELLELNFLGIVRCTRAAMPHLQQSRGHIVNVASLAAKSATKHLGAYPASKFPVAAYSQQLRYEIAEHGVHVLLACPGPIARNDSGGRYDDQASELPDTARKPGGGVRLKGIPVDTLAERILVACQRRRPELVVPWHARLLFAVAQISPSLGDWILHRIT